MSDPTLHDHVSSVFEANAARIDQNDAVKVRKIANVG
jgi:hypothetical protein